MRMWRHNGGMGGIPGLWPLLMILLLAVMLPTVCLLWFMTEAARNERMAVRQKLTELYTAQVGDLPTALAGYWKDKAIALSHFRDRPPPCRFEELVTNGIAESVIILDDSGKLVYPDIGARVETIAMSSTNEYLAVTSLRADVQARIRAGDEAGALRIVQDKLADGSLENTRDDEGRLILPYLLLFVVENASNRADAAYRRVLDELAQRTSDYHRPMPSAQRLFIMGQLTALGMNMTFPTLRAEELASRLLEAPSYWPRDSFLAPTPSSNLWQLASEDGSAIGIFSRGRLASDMRTLIENRARWPGATVMPAPVQEAAAREPFVTVPAGASLPGWELRVFLEGPNPFAAAAEKQVAVYFWTALLVIFVIVILAALMARYAVRQIRLTRLKNDLVATVSHELKTPLASTRVLVDTLLEGRRHDGQQTREYLELIAKENERLSRLIDNFLAFSRMERNKRAFEFARVEPAQLVDAAACAVRDKFEAGGCALRIDIDPHLPPVVADRDALTTVLLNLLDNAYKYSVENKQIAVRAYSTDRHVCFEVQDHGIGLTRRDMKRIWDRFYQADRSLSRRVGGCGLGLSIVKFIVEAHGGSVEVKSRLGEGSTFTVRLPVGKADAR
ncbi:MAG: ATP-binding protein [bacterium]